MMRDGWAAREAQEGRDMDWQAGGSIAQVRLFGAGAVDGERLVGRL